MLLRYSKSFAITDLRLHLSRTDRPISVDSVFCAMFLSRAIQANRLDLHLFNRYAPSDALLRQIYIERYHNRPADSGIQMASPSSSPDVFFIVNRC